MNKIADLLNLKHLSHTLPKEFKGFYNENKYRTSQDYLKVNTHFEFITSTVDLLILLIFWFSGGFPYIDGIVRSLGVGTILTGLLFIGLLMIAKLVISLPFSIYSTFVIEEKFGFNKTTPKLFITDLFKSVLLSIVLGGIFLSAILSFLEYGGPNAWIMCWTASAVFLIAVQYIVPTWIMPLFNKFNPLPKGDLKTAIMTYADAINFSISNIFVMDGSKRSSKSNAFFTGVGKNKRIVLFDTLVKEHTIEELVSILAHEMGHYKKKHLLKRRVLEFIQMGVIFYLISVFITHEGLFNAFSITEPSIYTGLIFFGMLYSPIDLLLSMLLQMSSRKDEYQADDFAKNSIKDSKPLITALKKLSVQNLSNLTPHPFYVFLNYSHPPVLNRIRILETT